MVIETTEYQVCCAIKDFADLYQLPMIHVANEGLRSKFTGPRLKRIGLTPGASDYFFLESNDNYKALWLEVKTCKGRPTEAQKSFIALVNGLGYYGTIGYGVDDCIAIIKKFYGI